MRLKHRRVEWPGVAPNVGVLVEADHDHLAAAVADAEDVSASEPRPNNELDVLVVHVVELEHAPNLVHGDDLAAGAVGRLEHDNLHPSSRRGRPRSPVAPHDKEFARRAPGSFGSEA
jgi:hypothetical protein